MKRGANTRKLSDEQVVDILQSEESDAQTGKRYGVSRSTIGYIRSGKHFVNIRPDIPRRSSKTCSRCQHWENARCTFGFPDPQEEGLRAATYCNLYAPG
jgi:hypothetical protein